MQVFFVPIFFIIFETLIEFFIWKLDGKDVMNTEQGWRKFTVKAWLFTYFYTFLLYSSACFMNPGYLKLSWIREVQNDPTFKEELDDNGERSYCEICNMPRPLRAHHCSTCKKCVLLMDHHCDFIGNCVGYRNYKAFIVFLIEYPIHCILLITVSSFRLTAPDKTGCDILFFLFCLIAFSIICFVVVMQLFAQIPFALHNQTWIEISRNKIRDALYRRAGQKQENRYDTLSVYNNLKQRLGQNPLLWLIPTPNNGNPYSFPTNPHFVPVYELRFNTFSNYDDDDERNPLLPAARLRAYP